MRAMKDQVAQAALAVSENSDTLLKANINRRMSVRAVRQAEEGYFGEEVQPLLDQASPHHVTHNVLRRIERQGLSIRRGLSFSAQMIAMSEARRLSVLRPSWQLDAKNSAYAFLDRLDVRRPQSDSRAYRFAEIPEQIPGVVKATKSTGARGCYLIFSPEKIVHVKDNKTFTSLEEYRAHAEGLMSGAGGTRKLPDRWMVEELILEDSQTTTAARNLKFYCFYGEVLFMQESRREPDLEVTFWTPDGQPTVTGRYEELAFDGVGLTTAQVETVARISREIPHPFMRIDMLNGEDEMVFGEFTPRPGSFDEFNDHWDRAMGEAWARAESRILEDLLRGKRFDAYLESTGLLGADGPADQTGVDDV